MHTIDATQPDQQGVCVELHETPPPPPARPRFVQRVGGRILVVLVATAVALTAWVALPVAASKVLIHEHDVWQFWRAESQPVVTWSSSVENLGWPSGKAPLGFGASGLGTTLDRMPVLSTYFRQTFTISDPDELSAGARFTTIADDGIIVYVNGHDVGRERVANTGVARFSEAAATEAVSTAAARRRPVTFTIPAQYLKVGRNVVAVQVIAHSADTADISFSGTLRTRGGGDLPHTGIDPNLRLVWADEFDQPSLDTAVWTPLDHSHFGDAGLQTECLMDRPENLTLRDGTLVITARKEQTPLKCGSDDDRFPQGRSYSSAHITSRDRIQFHYGRIEMRARIPVGQGTSAGLWPAFWMRPADGGLGEIDIMEAIGSGPEADHSSGVVIQTAHRDYEGSAPSAYSYQLPHGGTMDDGFHTYAVEWTEHEMRWFVDGTLTRSINSETVPWYKDAFVGRDFFLRINMAVGGKWPGPATEHTQFPAEYVVDYVRVYQ